MASTIQEPLTARTVDGRELHAGVVNEKQVRAAAGLTMVIGGIAFAYAYFDANYVLLQVASTVFFVEFVIRLTLGIRYSPVGAVAGLMTAGTAPEWVSSKPKNFAWTLGLGLAFSMTIITNSGIRGMLPRTLCAICLTLMWMEASLGLCLGCKVYTWLVGRGWMQRDSEIEVCANGVCELPAR